MFNYSNSDKIWTDSEIRNITYMSGIDHGDEWNNDYDESYQGIEFFYAFNCNEPLKELNLSKYTKLKHLIPNVDPNYITFSTLFLLL